MENKKLHNFRLMNSLFFEARFVYDEPKKEGEPVPEGEKKEDKKEGVDGKDLEAAKGDVEKEAKAARDKAKAEAEAAKRRDTFIEEEKLPKKPRRGPETKVSAPKEEEAPKPRPVPEKVSMKLDEFLKRDFTQQNNKIDRWKINVHRENTKINAQTWDHSTLPGLQGIYDDCRNLRIINQDPEYYETMFAILRSAADEKNPYLAENAGAYRPMFKSPTDGASRDAIAGLPKKSVTYMEGKDRKTYEFFGGEAYIRAYDSLLFLKANVLIAQDKVQLETLDKQQKQGVDPIGTTVVDFGKSQVNTIQKAIRDRDYATLAVYGVGAYALWQTLGKKIFGDGHGHGGGDHGHGGIDFKKWLLIGAAVYASDKMLKNAGYDVMKMAGFKGMNAEVRGTPLESMSNILSQSEYSEEMKDLDYGIALTMSETKLTTLQELMLQSNKNGIHFIHPREFPALFPDVKNAWPFKMGKGEEGMKDYIGMSNSKLSPSEREYIRVGQQIYKLALAMGTVYDKTLHANHETYKGMSYEKALQDPTLSKSKVRHLMEAASQYAPESVAGGVFSTKKAQEVEEKLRAGTDKVLENNGFTLDGLPLQEGSGHFGGTLKGFPVVVVVAKEGYRVYLRNNYGDKYNSVPGTNFTLIPLDGAGMARGAKDAVKKVDERMKELVKVLKDKNKNISGVVYEDGQWKATTKFTGAADLDVPASDVPTIIKVVGDGKSLIVDNGENAGDNYLERSVLGRLIEQKEFKALGYFAGAGRLHFKDDKSGDSIFTIRIGKKAIEAKIKYDKSSKQFRFEPASGEAELLKSGSGFAEEFGEIVGESKAMTEVIESWKRLIENAPESYFVNLFKSMPEWFTKATLENPVRGLSLKGFTGAIPKNYTLGLIESQRALVISKLVASMGTVSKLENVTDSVNTIFTPALRDLERQRDEFSAQVTKKRSDGKDFSAEDFKTDVFNKLGEIGLQSNDYKTWYRQFVDETYAHYGMDDLRKGNAIKARDLVKVFAYYTSVVDDPAMDGANMNLSLTPEDKRKIDLIIPAKRRLVDSGIKNPTATQISAALTPYLVTEDFINTTFKDYEKAEKYRMNSQYVNYVVGQINLKRNQDLLNTEVIPAPGAFWNITSFKDWTPIPTPEKFIDSREVLTGKKDYVEFDEYIARLRDSDPTNDVVSEDKIVLPRKTCSLILPVRSPERALFKKLALADNIENGTSGMKKMTKIEEAFHDKMQKALDELESKYREDLLPGAFNQLRQQYQLRYTAESDPTDTNKILYDFGLPNESGVLSPTSLSVEVERIESQLSGRRTVTRGYQEELINAAVYRILEHTIKDKDNFSRYFKTTSLREKMMEKWDDFRFWLFG